MNNNIRAIQLDLDTLADDNGYYDRDELEDHIVDTVVNSGANTVYLQSFIETVVPDDEEYNKKAGALFFKTPRDVKANIADEHLLGDAIRLIKQHQPECKVLAWAPTLNCAWLTEKHRDNEILTASQEERVWYCRATPFSKITHDVLTHMYYALGQVSSRLDGILFQDDLLMSNWEDTSRAGKALLRKLYQLDTDDEETLFDFLDDDDNPQNIEWQQYKTHCLNELSKALFQAFARGYRETFPEKYARRQSQKSTQLICARDLYALTIPSADSKSGEWYAQNLDLSLDLYDQVVIMAYYNEEFGYSKGDEKIATPRGRQWIHHLAQGAIDVANRDGLIRSNKLVMKLQSVIWIPGQDETYIDKNVLLAQARELKKAGIDNIGFYPALEDEAAFNIQTI